MTEEVLDEIFLGVFDWDTLPEKKMINKEEIDRWDSMMQLNIVSAIESEWDIVIELEDAIGVESYEAAINVVKKYT